MSEEAKSGKAILTVLGAASPPPSELTRQP